MLYTERQYGNYTTKEGDYVERQEERIKNFLEGRARSLTNIHPFSILWNCVPVTVLMPWSVHMPTYSVKIYWLFFTRKLLWRSTHPNPKHTDSIPYRDVKQQNDWLQSVFDTMGNYLYCCACICTALGISKRRLARQRQIKWQQSQHPIVEMSKGQVEDKLLGKYVIMPDSEDSWFKTWWRSLPESTVVSVRLPRVTHGNTGKSSNSAKKAVLQDFLAFVDANSEPNECSDNPTHYFVSIFYSSSS